MSASEAVPYLMGGIVGIILTTYLGLPPTGATLSVLIGAFVLAILP